MEEKINIVLLDGHQLFREGVKQVLDKEPTFHIIVNSDDYSVIMSALEVYEVDVLLIDVKLFMENQDHIRNIIMKDGIKVIVLAGETEKSYVTEAIKAGAHGYFLKEMDIYSFVDAIKLVKTGISYIHPFAAHDLVEDFRKLINEDQQEVSRPLHLYTRRECEVLQLLTDGKSNRQIAKALDISEKTVKNHVSSLFKKMKVNDRTQAVVTAIRNHWVEL